MHLLRTIQATMSNLTGDLESGSTSASPLPITDSPAIREHGSTSALPEIQMAENIPPTTVEIPTTPPGTANLSAIQKGENNIINGIEFYHAAINGDCRKAREICAQQPDIVRARITSESETGLHIAAAAKNLSFVKMLMKKMTPADIRITSRSNNTALCYAAASGIVKIARVIVAEVEDLPLVRGKGGMTPLHMAAELGHKDMVNYLLPLTDVDNELTDDEVMELFISLINTNLYEVARDLLKKYPTLATAHDKHKETALHVLARKPLSSKVDLDRGHWKGLITSDSAIYDSIACHKNATALYLVKGILEIVVQTLDHRSISELITVPTKLLFVATKLGNVEFITILMKYYLDLIWIVDDENRSMFHVAVCERQENIFRIIYEIGDIKDIILGRNASKKNNMLHMAAKLAPLNRLRIVSGAALQLQRELMWFKEVERIVLPSYKETKNTEGEGLTPKELFDKDHKELREEGEKWMKSTAQSCMIVSTLIATVMFAAAFNLPGGRMDNGTPNYMKKPSFIIFVIADSMSLFSSTATILVFLSILTSRHREEDFLHALPNKLMHGLVTLFVSMVMMMIAFTASMFIVFHGKLIGAAIAISFVAGIPVVYYLVLHFRLFADILSSTYNSKFIFQSSGTSLLGPDLQTREDVNQLSDDLKTDNLEEIIVQNEEEKSKGN